ncbi:MAG: ChrR family anti-sigma-E factor [Geminicoccaceae bacterium]
MTDCPTVDELLMAHAVGRLPEPLALVVGTHLALCPRARSRYSRFLALGGLLLERAEPAPLAADAFARLLERLDQEEQPAPACQRPVAWACAAPGLPRPLRDYLPGPLEAQRWRCYGSAAELELRLPTPGYRTTLVRVRAGRQVPRHTHEGHELTLVLAGGFSDKTGHYRRGDLAIADGTIDHRPTADADEDCLCLAVTDAPLRLTGMLGRLLNPFLRL